MLWMCALRFLNGLGELMEEWTDEFITAAQQELTAMVKDWQYDYGASDEECVAMLLWKVLRLKPDLKLDLDALKRSQQLSDQA